MVLTYSQAAKDYFNDYGRASEYPSVSELNASAKAIAIKAGAEWKQWLKDNSPRLGHDELDASPDIRFTPEQWLAEVIEEAMLDCVGRDYLNAVEAGE